MKLKYYKKIYTYQCLLWMLKKPLHYTSHSYNTRMTANLATDVPLYTKSHTHRFIFFFGPKLFNLHPSELKS